MKIFLDTANLESIKKFKSTGLVDGITTNPSHLSKESGDIVSLLKEICEVMNPYPVSIEVTESKPENVYEQAKKISALASNVIVKIPCAPEYLSIINKLVKEKINLNITLVFSLVQALSVAKLGVKYISPFIGRLDDIGINGLKLLQEIIFMKDIYGFESEILAASLRNIDHINGAILAGADIATIPVSLFENLSEHELTIKGMEKFNKDWEKLEIKKFP